jgi:hypothetical protein
MKFNTGAEEGSRTPDLLITNQLLYQLSYFGKINVKMTPFENVSISIGGLHFHIEQFSNFQIFSH